MTQYPSFDNEELNGFQLLDFNIGYTTLLQNDWRLGARLTPWFSSNLTVNDLTFEDIILPGDIVFTKEKTKDETVAKPWRLMLRVYYSGNRGFPFPLPFVSCYRKFNPNWSYNIGVPKSNLQFQFQKTID